MSRFSHLEFGGKDKPDRTDTAGEVVRDEVFFGCRARAAWLAGDFEEALRNYSRALEKNAAFYDGWFGQVCMLIELGEFREAKIWADKALEQFPEHPELLAAKAVACARDAELDKAQAYSDNALEKRGITAYVWLARAEVLLARNSRMAENCLSNAVGIAGSDAPFVRLQAGRILRVAGHYSLALEYLQKTAAELPKAPLTWYELACCQAHLGLPEAKQLFNQCLKLRPNWPDAQAGLAAFQNRSFFSRLAGAFRRLFS
jgi:tetratricopeptide (TPR) repeat protein